MTDTAQIEALLAKATSGPWIASKADMFGDHDIQSKDGVETDSDHSAIAAVVSNLRHPEVVAANAALIVALRNNAEALLAAVKERDALRSAVEWIDYHKDNQDMGHEQFRIGAGNQAIDALWWIENNRAALKEQTNEA